MKNKLIIGFVAPKQFGKTTACNIVQSILKDSVVQINFKDALIEELKRNFPNLLQIISSGKEIDDLFITKPPLIRALMQNYGTEVRRGNDKDYWVDRWAVKIKGDKHVVCDDVRFLNEAKRIKDLGGILIRLHRTDLDNDDNHISETEQRQILCDHLITISKDGQHELQKHLESILCYSI